LLGVEENHTGGKNGSDESVNGTNRSEKGSGALVFLAVLLLLLLVGSLVVSWKRWEGQAPIARFDHEFKSLGRSPILSLVVEDAGSGLRSISVVLKQKEQSIPLVEEQYPGPSSLAFWRTGSLKSANFEIGKLIKEKYQVQEGPASLNVSVSDYALRNFFRGNQTRFQRDFVFDIYPPKLELLSGQHYINQGGSECVVYRVSPDAEVSGVQAGPYFFPAYPANSADPNIKFCLFAFAYNIPTDSPLKVIARDEAGNEASAGFWYKLFPKKFRSSDMKLDDSFLQKVVPEIMSHTPEIKDQGDLVKTYVEINSRLRQLDHAAIRELCKKSAPRFLWDGAFLQLSNSKVESLFADHRTYFYQGKKIDQQDHVGFDLSVVQQYPIESSNDGVVVYADYFGIYGNCVMVDHGCGLLSLYGHLSSINVKVGQQVKKKEVLGRSGATGLAGGDHLHFGLFLQGVPVNPTEWWDGKWIKDHVLDRIKAASEQKAGA
jgi:murein DD-endopeptidase MepM/ murein hydrolase activator NlpD